MNHKNQSWTNEHWVFLAQIIAEYDVVPGQHAFKQITSRHNAMCETSRSVSAVMNGFARLREARLFANNKDLWDILSSKPEVFAARYRKKANGKKNPKSNERIENLEKGLNTISEQVTMILEALTRKEES